MSSGIYALVRKPDRDKAQSLLEQLWKQVQPIMQQYRWTVTHLREFFPTNPNLLGVNVNRGAEIRIRLRPHHNQHAFLPYEDLLGTMLHELVHNTHSEHDAKFYQLLDKITQEMEDRMVRGYVPFGGGQGHRLGGAALGTALGSGPIRTTDLRQQRLRALQQRRYTTAGTGTSGRRLGGSSTTTTITTGLESICTPRELAVMAAMQRVHDAVWCGACQEYPADKDTAPTEVEQPSIVKVIDLDTEQEETKQESSTSSAPPSPTQDGWTCLQCTYWNQPLHLQCLICLHTRPTMTVDLMNKTTTDSVP